MAEISQKQGVVRRVTQFLFGNGWAAEGDEHVVVEHGTVVSVGLHDEECAREDEPSEPIRDEPVGESPTDAIEADASGVDVATPEAQPDELDRPDNQGIAQTERLPRIEHFWPHLEVAGRSPRTVREYQYEYKWWKAQAEARWRTVYTLRRGDVERSVRGLHPATVRRKLSFLRTLARWYAQHGFADLHTELSQGVQSPKLPSRVPLDRGPEAFRELRGRARAWCAEGRREGVWLGLMLMAGLRISEVPTARDAGDSRVKVIGKGDKERLLPVPGWVREAMETLPREGRGGWGKQRQLVWRCLAREGIRRPHSLRHTYASELLRRGKSIEEIRVLLGHSNVGTTNVYARLQTPPNVVELLEGDA